MFGGFGEFIISQTKKNHNSCELGVKMFQIADGRIKDLLNGNKSLELRHFKNQHFLSEILEIQIDKQ